MATRDDNGGNRPATAEHLSGPEWSHDGDPVADFQIAIELLERQAREPLRPFEPSEGLRQLAEAFAARHGFSPPPRPSPPSLPLELRFAIESGMMSEGQARDLDAFADGMCAAVASGALTEEQADALTEAAAIRDAQAVKRARARQATGNRHERRAAAAERKRR